MQEAVLDANPTHQPSNHKQATQGIVMTCIQMLLPGAAEVGPASHRDNIQVTTGTAYCLNQSITTLIQKYKKRLSVADQKNLTDSYNHLYSTEKNRSGHLKQHHPSIIVALIFQGTNLEKDFETVLNNLKEKDRQVLRRLAVHFPLGTSSTMSSRMTAEDYGRPLVPRTMNFSLSLLCILR